MLQRIQLFGVGLVMLFLAVGCNHAVSVRPSTSEASVTEKSYVAAAEESKTFAAEVPILMYHHIAPKVPQQPYFVSPDTFKQQLQWLQDHGYSVISLDDLYEGLTGKQSVLEKSVVLTFDDGDIDQYENAVPILKKFGYTATFYVITGKVGEPEYMSWEQLGELQKLGMTIGAHSVTHPNLARLNSVSLQKELEKSKADLEKHLHIGVNHFAYPGGSYSHAVELATQTAGYLTGVTTNHMFVPVTKPSLDTFSLPRIHIDDDLVSFEKWFEPK